MASFFAVTPQSETAEFYEAFLKTAAALYPQSAKDIDFREKFSQNLVSPHVTELPTAIKLQAEEIAKAFFALRNSAAWKNRLQSLAPSVTDPCHTSVLMSYDFHVDSSGQLRLIEINTNASLSLLVDIAHQTHGIANQFSDHFRERILDSFMQEHQEACEGGKKGDLSRIAIVDEKPETQRLYGEFKLFEELFSTRGWKTNIYDPSELEYRDGELRCGEGRIDLVYNRDTDFYFTKEVSLPLREAMTANASCITPHPFEYRLLADKERLLELSNGDVLERSEISDAQKEIIRKALIRTIDIHTLSPESLWAERKKWFFKPRNSHGGKAVYRGSSTSKTTFETILKGDYLAQEIVPPPLLKFKNDPEEFKSDLRFYAYRDQVQIACARLYRGQMTNAQTLGGGASVINWT